MHKGWVSYDAPMLYALGFIGLFTIGGLTGLISRLPRFRCYVTDTYFVIAHFHYIMVGGMVTAYFGGAALLVAEDHRPALSRILGARGGDPDLLRFQYDVLSAVHPWRAGNAAPLPRLSAGTAGLERAVLCRRIDPRR